MLRHSKVSPSVKFRLPVAASPRPLARLAGFLASPLALRRSSRSSKHRHLKAWLSSRDPGRRLLRYSPHRTRAVLLLQSTRRLALVLRVLRVLRRATIHPHTHSLTSARPQARPEQLAL